MPFWLTDLVNLALRWLHVIAAIFWIGQTALFTWLDTRMRVESGAGGRDLWMVHGGGFYRVEKLAWQVPPKVLHWFKWESALTWGSGFLLLLWVYHGGGILLPPESGLSGAAGAALSVGTLAAGWVVYDVLWQSPVGRRSRLAGLLSLALLGAFAWGLGQVLTGRATYLQVGATLGTIMAANVWMRILPPMRRAVAAATAGEEVGDDVRRRLATAALRSRHNTFMAFPVVILMLSTHYPVTTYGHRAGWAILVLLVVVGMAARWLVNRHEAKP